MIQNLTSKIQNLRQHSGFMKYFKNTSWLFTEKILRIGLGLFVTIWMARYLGPEEFGIYSYAFAFVGLFGVFSSLGLDQLISKELLNNPDENNQILGSSFVLRIIGSITMFILASVSIAFIRPDNELMLILVMIFSSAFLFRSFEVIKYWFETHIKAKYSSIIFTIAMIISSLLRVILILNESSILYFAYVVAIESILIAAGLVFIYLSQSNKLSSWKASFKKSKYLLKEAWPMILSGVVVMVYTRVDQIMLGNILGDESVGIYAAAVKISEGWMFVPVIIATSFFPAMLNARKRDYSLYLERTQHLLNLMVIIGISAGIFFMFISSFFINLTFGENFSESSSILVIHIWGMLFQAISIISYRYFIAEGLQIYSFYRAFAGLILNIALNYYLIPIYGVLGAAIATVISQIIAVYLLNGISSKTRAMFFMQTKALTLIGTFQTIKNLKSIKESK